MTWYELLGDSHICLDRHYIDAILHALPISLDLPVQQNRSRILLIQFIIGVV